jgi:hypothetical protein
VIDTAQLQPQWRTVESAVLGRTIQVRRPTVGDASLPVERLWARLVRDGDGTPLMAPTVDPTTVSASIVDEIVRLALEAPNPSTAPVSDGLSAKA